MPEWELRPSVAGERRVVSGLSPTTMFLYFFSPDCPSCRVVDSAFADVFADPSISRISLAPSPRTDAYSDSVGMPAEWLLLYDSIADTRLAGVPTLVEVDRHAGVLFVANVTSGSARVMYLLDRIRTSAPKTAHN